MDKNLYKSMVYKVDWFSFTVSDTFDGGEDGKDFVLLENLGYDINDFETVPGRYFYNSGITLGRYVNIYYNNYDEKLMKNTSNTRNYVFTGQGCTDLGQKIENDWVSLFEALKQLDVKITRLDIALDDYNAVVSFDKMERKLKLGHYRSSKKSYNIVRAYDKYAQYQYKNQIPPREAIETGIWQRYEISYTKKKARKIVDLMTEDGQTIGSVFMDTMRDIVEFLEPTKTQAKEIQQNKNRWKVCSWWERFLDGAGKVNLGNPEKDVDLGRLLQWLRVSVVPSLKILEELGDEKGFDIYQTIKKIEVGEYSKKQNRLLNNAKKIDKSQINLYLQKFEEGGL